MACLHKFTSDLHLQYVEWEVRTLFIGTFNPDWKSCTSNNATWFYGRTSRNEFWCILPTIHEQQSLLTGNRRVWIDFCQRNHLAVTDIIERFDEADETNPQHRVAICGFKDEELVAFQPIHNNIPAILEANPSIKQIVITRKTLPPFWKTCFAETFDWIRQHPQRQIQVRMLRSPSRGAINGVTGNFCDFVSNQWLNQGYVVL